MRLEDVYDRLDEQRRLARILMPRFLRLLQAWHEMVASVFGLSAEEFRLDDPATRKQLAHAAERVVLIDQGTRAAPAGGAPGGPAAGLLQPRDRPRGARGRLRGHRRALPEHLEGASETIARTEIAEAQNVASLDRYAATGMVDRVQIVEHEDTDEPCASRNGTVVPLASKPGLLHPNCQMGLIPW